MARQRELGRGERVLPGLWRLRLPLPWPGVPHCNAWAIAAGDGIVLVDCGMHEPGSMAQLERAMEQVNLRVEQVRRLVCTHAHADHWGQAGPIVDRAGCELLMHPAAEGVVRRGRDPVAAVERRLEIARQSGVPPAALAAYAQRAAQLPSGVARYVEADGPLLDGVTIGTDLGEWTVVETPGHAPSHVCLFNAERRVLISGDHVLGRISLYYDFGETPDPVGEFLASLERVDVLGARLAVSGHGRPFTDVGAHVEANRALVAQRLGIVAAGVADEPRTAVQIAPLVHGEPLRDSNAAWFLSETLCYLTHLERRGQVTRIPGDGDHPERWEAHRPAGEALGVRDANPGTQP